MIENTTETIQMRHDFKCPRCGHIETYLGLPGERRIVNCSSCGLQGQVTIPGVSHININKWFCN